MRPWRSLEPSQGVHRLRPLRSVLLRNATILPARKAFVRMGTSAEYWKPWKSPFFSAPNQREVNPAGVRERQLVSSNLTSVLVMVAVCTAPSVFRCGETGLRPAWARFFEEDDEGI